MSLEALQLYTLGTEKRGEGEYDSVQFLERAVQLDPEFALAHAELGTVYLNLEQLALAEQHERKAIALSSRVSEREMLYITAHYYVLIGQRAKAIVSYETYHRLYPRDLIPEGNLANEYLLLGRFSEALEHALGGIRLNPEDSGISTELASAYLGLGRIDDARAAISAALKRNPNSSALHLTMSNIALAQGDTETRKREDAVLKGSPNGNLNLLYRDAALAASRGQFHQAQSLYQQAIQLALKLGLNENASFALALEAVYEAYLLKPVAAKDSIKKALHLSQMKDTVELAAVALAAAGEIEQAERLMGKLARDCPDDVNVQFVWVPTIHALASLKRSDADGAVSSLGPAVPYDRGNLDAMLVRANALLRSGRGSEAAEEFRRILDQQMRSPSDPVCSLAQLGLARAYAQMGERVLSRAAYEKFLTMWQDADPDLPALQQAKEEYRMVK